MAEAVMAHRIPPPPPKPKYVLREGMGPVSSLDFGPDDSLYVGTQDGWIHVWNLISNRKKTSFQVGNSVCLTVKVIFNKLVTQIKGDCVSVRSLTEGYELLHKVSNPYIGFCKIEVDPSQAVFMPSENSEIKVLLLDCLETQKKFSCPSEKLGEVMVIKYIRYQQSSLLIVGYESGDIYLWDVNKGAHVSKFKINNVPMAIDFDEDKGQGACGTEADTVLIFRIESDFSFCHEKILHTTNPGVSAVIIRPDKKIMVLGCWDGNLRVYSWKSGRILGVLSEHVETVNVLSYSSNAIKLWGSILLAAGSKDKSVSLWSFF